MSVRETRLGKLSSVTETHAGIANLPAPGEKRYPSKQKTLPHSQDYRLPGVPINAQKRNSGERGAPTGVAEQRMNVLDKLDGCRRRID
jgi:hypothetical protein